MIPALAIAQELRTAFNAEVLFIGSPRGIENRLVPARGFELRVIEIGGLKSVSLATRVKTLFDLPRAVVKSSAILSEFRPDVVIGVGGYASGPAMLAAAMRSIPTLAFEPNVVPGLANRIVAPMVTAAAVHFDETCRYFRRCNATGVPVRREFFSAQNTIPAVAPCGPKQCGERRPTLLVFGGSQGAHAINQAVIDALPMIHAELPNLVLLHQTGERDYTLAQPAYLAAGVSAEISPFIDDMPTAFARADLIVCRSGASTVAELSAAGKPAILVPFPFATDDHQLRNAEALVRAGAAELIPESELTPERLVAAVKSLLCENRDRLRTMAESARKLSRPDAAHSIAALAARIGGIPARHSYSGSM